MFGVPDERRGEEVGPLCCCTFGNEVGRVFPSTGGPKIMPGISGRTRSATSRGKLIGSRPEGFTSPNSTRAMASPPRAPGYQACSTAATRRAGTSRP